MSFLKKADWYRDQNSFILGELIADAADWVNHFGYDSITYLDLNGEPHELNATGADRGKVAYIGSVNEAANGKPYVTVTVINQRASIPNESYTGSAAVVERLWDDYKSANSTPRKPRKRAVLKRPEASKEKTEADKNKRNVLKDKALFGRLSNDPQDTQAAYLDAKGILRFIPGGKIRYGTDKHGNFAAIQLFDVSGREFKGLQRFYDRNIKGRDTNKDFTWGLIKGGSCHILGEIGKGYVGIVYICEGYADGVVVFGLTNAPVFIALDAYNLEAVTQAVKAEYPKAQGVVICDNDAYKYTKGIDNVGVLSGVDAATKTGYNFVIPNFSKKEKSEGQPKDLWDLWSLRGDEGVEELLKHPQSPNDEEGVLWDFLGLKSLLGAATDLAKKVCKLTGTVVFEAVGSMLIPSSERVGVTVGEMADHASEIATDAQKALKAKAVARYQYRLEQPTEVVNIPKDLNGVELLHKTTVVQSGLGTGKTQWIKDVVLGHKDIENVLIVLPRITLAKNAADRLEAANYEDIKAATPQNRHDMDTRRIVTVSNSLELLDVMMLLPKDKEFDAIILDEVELNIHHLFGNTFSGNERLATLKILKRLIEKAKYVVCAQAQVTPLTRDFLNAFGRDEIHVIRNEYQRYEELKVDLFAKKGDCKMQLDEWIKQGKPVIVPCTSAKFARGLAKELEAKFPNKKILEVDSDNANEPRQAKFLAGTNADAPNWDVAIHSPSLEQGVSIDAPHFKNVVGFCGAGEGVCAPDSFVQMLFRSRSVNNIAIYVEPRVDTLPVNFDQYMLEEGARAKLVAEAIEIKGKRRWVFDETDEVILAAKAKASTQAAKNKTQEEVYAILASMGCDISVRDNWIEESSDGVEALKAAKELQKSEYVERVGDAPLILPSQCKEIEGSTKPTLDQVYMVKRHKLKREMAVSLSGMKKEEKEETFVFWNQGRGRKMIDALGQALLSPAQAIAITNHFFDTQPQNSPTQGFWVQWLIRAGILETLGVTFNEGVFEFSLQWFCYEDLRESWWWKWALEHRDAVNGASLGARIKGAVRSNDSADKIISLWIRALGVKLTFKAVDLKWCEKDENFVTRSAITSLKNNSLTCHKNSRAQIRVYRVDAKATPIYDVLSRRFKANTMPYSKIAHDYLEEKAQNDFDAGIKTQYPIMPKPIESQLFMVRRLVQNGILESLHIELNDDGIYECDP